MTVRTFQGRMPQLIAAFVPMVTVGAVVTPLSHHAGGDAWIPIVISLLLELLGFVLMFAVGLKKYHVSIGESEIIIAKQRFAASEIISLRLRKQGLDITARSRPKRGLVTFEKKDLPVVTDALRSFADQHNISFEIK